MKTASLRMSLNEAPDFFTPAILGRILGVNAKAAYELARSAPFARRVGRKIIISKTAFLRWWEGGAAGDVCREGYIR